MKPVHFTHLDHIKNSRPAFDETCLITTQNFADLIGDYTFPEDAHCQVERKDSKGVLCGHEHRKGWVGRCKDGREGLIGSSCGPTYFKDHADFKYHRALVTRELDLDDVTMRLRAIEREGTFLQQVDACGERLRSLREQSKELVDSLPNDVHQRLRAMAKTGNASVNIEVDSPRMVEDSWTGKERLKSSWVSQSIGSIAGLAVVDRTQLIDVGKELKIIRNTFTSLDTRREAGIRKLKSQIKTLESLSAQEFIVAELGAQFEAFKDPENLRNFWLLSRQQESQYRCMQLYSTAAGSPNPSNNRLRALLGSAEETLRRSNRDRQVRPAIA